MTWTRRGTILTAAVAALTVTSVCDAQVRLRRAVDVAAPPEVNGPVQQRMMPSPLPGMSASSLTAAGELRQPDYLRRDAPVFEKELGLDGSQTQLFTAHLQDYLDAFEAARVSLETDLAALHQEFTDSEAAEQMNAMMQEYLEDILAPLHGDTDGAVDFTFGAAPQIASFQPGAAWAAGPPPGVEGLDEGEGVVMVAMTMEIDEDTAEDAEPQGSGQAFVGVGGADGMHFVTTSSLDGPLSEEDIAKFREMAEQMEREMMKRRLEIMESEQMQAFRDGVTDREAAFRAEKERLKNNFHADTQAMLEPQQLERWPVVQRKLRRIKSLPKGQLSGERLDLVRLIGELDLNPDQRDAVAPLLEEYEQMLDVKLTQRDQYRQDTAMSLKDARIQRDADRIEEVDSNRLDHRAAVRNINTRYLDTLATALPAVQARELQDAAYHSAFNRAYRKTMAERIFAAALELEDLDPDFMAAIVDLEQDFLSELEVHNDSLRQEIIDFEPKQRQLRIDHRVARLRGEDSTEWPENPVEERFSRRSDLCDGYVKRLHKLLTPDQIAALPSRNVITLGNGVQIELPADMPEEVRDRLQNIHIGGIRQLDNAQVFTEVGEDGSFRIEINAEDGSQSDEEIIIADDEEDGGN